MASYFFTDNLKNEMESIIQKIKLIQSFKLFSSKVKFAMIKTIFFRKSLL